MATMEEELLKQIEKVNAENERLKLQLEITLAVVDEIALGGAL